MERDYVIVTLCIQSCYCRWAVGVEPEYDANNERHCVQCLMLIT